MIIVRLKGGLGNQLFQFACGRAIAELRKEELFFDLNYLTINPLRFTPRNFKLGNLNNYKIAGYEILRCFNELRDKGKGVFISEKCLKSVFFKSVNDPMLKAIYLDGYYQDVFYFLNSEKLIREEIRTLLNNCLLNSDDKFNYLFDTGKENVSVHLRRGDYLLPATLKIHGICDVAYYREAIRILNVNVRNTFFFVFSDDWGQADLTFSELLPQSDKMNISKIVNESLFEDDDLLELALMSRCKHFIIANSSFSWWGAYLSDFTNKHVIAPKEWYRDPSLKQLSDDIALPNWIRI